MLLGETVSQSKVVAFYFPWFFLPVKLGFVSFVYPIWVL